MLTHIGEGDLLYPVKFELPIQMLIFARKNLTDHPESVLPAIWASFNSVNLIHELHHHKLCKIN